MNQTPQPKFNISESNFANSQDDDISRLLVLAEELKRNCDRSAEIIEDLGFTQKMILLIPSVILRSCAWVVWQSWLQEPQSQTKVDLNLTHEFSLRQVTVGILERLGLIEPLRGRDFSVNAFRERN